MFSIYSRNLIKRRFAAVKVENPEFLKNRDRRIPLILYANHSSWWDGLIAFHLCQTCGIDGFVMMEERQLKDLQLFRKLGAFSVIRENPREAVKSINYAVELLKVESNRAVLIFPQGTILPNDARPLQFFAGLSRIVEKLEIVQTFPIALRYEFLQEFKPEIFVKIGKPEIFSGGKSDSKELTNHFSNCLTYVLDELKDEIISNKLSNYNDLI